MPIQWNGLGRSKPSCSWGRSDRDSHGAKLDENLNYCTHLLHGSWISLDLCLVLPTLGSIQRTETCQKSLNLLGKQKTKKRRSKDQTGSFTNTRSLNSLAISEWLFILSNGCSVLIRHSKNLLGPRSIYIIHVGVRCQAKMLFKGRCDG